MMVVNVETTGLDPKKHSIVSIGAINFSNSTNQFYQECRIQDGAEIMVDALQINGFSEEQIKDKNKRSLEKVIKDFLLWAENCNDKTIASNNSSFDRDFLKASAEKYKIDWKLSHRTIDLHSVCYFNYLKEG